MRALLLANLIACGWICSAQAIVVDFQSGNISASGSYVQNGVNIQVNNYASGYNATIQAVASPTNFALTLCSIDGACSPGTSITVTYAGLFAITSIDGQKDFPDTANGLLNLVGHVNDGTTVTRSLVIDYGFKTFAIGGFTNLVSLDINSTLTYASDIDNLVVVRSATSVLEPASLTLLGMGLVGVAAFRQRRAG